MLCLEDDAARSDTCPVTEEWRNTDLRSYEAGLWRIACGAVLDPTGPMGGSGIAMCRPILADPDPTGAFIGAVDAVIGAILDVSEWDGWNPACTADSLLTEIAADLGEVNKLLLLAATKVLAKADPYGEAGTPHATCRQWPDGSVRPRIASSGLIPTLQVTFANNPQLSRDPQLAVTVTQEAPELLFTVVMAGARGDTAVFLERMRSYVDSTR